MSDPYLWLKWVHILSSTILFGTGIGTAFQMWKSHLDGNTANIAAISRNVVLADWLFTLPAGIIQPVSGLALIHLAGHDITASWLMVSYALYAIALSAWLPVVWLQMRIRDISSEAVRDKHALPPLYYKYMRAWFMLGWPAFIALMAIFYLMIAKPDLW